MKLCIIYNFAAHYRQSVFVQIDRSFECDWFFGKRNADIKRMDYSLLNGEVSEVETWHSFGQSYQKGVLKLLKRPYTHYLMLGDTRSVSTWLFLLLAKFYPKKKVYLWTHGWYGKESRLERVMKKVFFRLPNGGIFLYGNYARELMLK